MTIEQKTTEFLQKLAGYLNIEHAATVDTVPHGDGVMVSVAIQTPEQGKLLIGKSGQNLQALEQVLRTILMRHEPQVRGVSIDINDYRKAKMREITDLVVQTANRVRETQKSEALPPMTSYERRIVHTELASWTDLATESVGQDPQRRVVIRPL